MTYNGIRKEWLRLERGRRESPFAPLNHNLTHVPGMAGGHITSTNVDMIRIDQPIGFTVEGEEHEQELLDELKAWLLTDEDVEIEFDNVPGKTYIGRVTDELGDYARPAPRLRSGTLTFLCKPYKNGDKIIRTIDGSVFNYVGTAPTYPVITCTFSASETSFTVENQDGLKVKVNYNFQANDVLELDFETQKVSINGVVQMPALAWTVSDWFAIAPGDNKITSSHPAEMEYVERWL